MRPKLTHIAFPGSVAFGGVVPHAFSTRHDRSRCCHIGRTGCGVVHRPGHRKEPFAQTNLRIKCHRMGWMASAPQQLGPLLGVKPSKIGHGHVSGTRAERRGTGTWQGREQGFSSQAGEQLDLLCCA